MRRLAEIGTEVVPDQSLLIDGERVTGRGPLLSTRYPATLDLLAEFPAASPAHRADAVGAARHAFNHGPWPRLAVAERALRLAAMADHLQARLPELARLVGLEQPGDVLALKAAPALVAGNTVVAAILGDMPVGGYKASGLGREAGHWGIEEYTELKSVITDPSGKSTVTFG